MTSATWFPYPDKPNAAARLFCFPPSGGGATTFRAWIGALPDAIAVRPVQMPGRESRLGEPPAFDVNDIAGALSRATDRRYALYGHSLGGLVAYETARELVRLGCQPPVCLFVGACRPPDDVSDLAGRLLSLPDDEFLEWLTALGGIPTQVVQNQRLRTLVLPILRSDFAWLDGYRHRAEPVLAVPVVAFAGAADRMVPPEVVSGWGRVTSARFRLCPVAGDHFSVLRHPDVAVAEIAHRLLARDPAPG